MSQWPFPFLITRILQSLQPPLCLAFWAWVLQSPRCCQGVQVATELEWLPMARSQPASTRHQLSASLILGGSPKAQFSKD